MLPHVECKVQVWCNRFILFATKHREPRFGTCCPPYTRPACGSAAEICAMCSGVRALIPSDLAIPIRKTQLAYPTWRFPANGISQQMAFCCWLTLLSNGNSWQPFGDFPDGWATAGKPHATRSLLTVERRRPTGPFWNKMRGAFLAGERLRW